MDHLRHASLKVCKSAVDHLARALFDDGLEDLQWSNKGDVTRCRFFGERQMKKNFILRMFKEQLGLGPDYCLLIALIEPCGAASNVYLECYHMRKWSSNYIV